MLVSNNFKYLDFDVIKEPWTIYSLSDGSSVKVKLVLKRIKREMRDNKPHFSFDPQPITVVQCNPDLCGNKNTTKYTRTDLMKAIDVPDVQYNTVNSDFNQYVVEDGTKIKVFIHVSKIARTKLYSSTGELIYQVDVGIEATIEPSQHYATHKP